VSFPIRSPPSAIRHCADQTPEVVWPRGPGRQVSRSFPCSTSLHIACPKELQAASRSSKTYLAKDGGGSRKICANLILASRQGFGELKTEQVGGHSQEQQRHRQAPIDDDDESSIVTMAVSCIEILVENRDFFMPHCIRCPVRGGGGPSRNIAITFGVENLEWCVSMMVKRVLQYV